VRVIASDLDVYVGVVGTVADYDDGAPPDEQPLVGVVFDAPVYGAAIDGSAAVRDGFYADELVAEDCCTECGLPERSHRSRYGVRASCEDAWTGAMDECGAAMCGVPGVFCRCGHVSTPGGNAFALQRLAAAKAARRGVP
jgi:hypothetical protein